MSQFFDELLDYVGFGDEDIADMGQWSDGEPVRPLEIDAPSPPPR